jgi:beta-N-acetylhexosaminidase
VPLFIATDQEGGQVQVLSGHGFSEIPSALEQGAMTPDELQSAAQQWGSELARAGVNLDLAPVADIVRSADADNAPIAAFDREYGFTAAQVDPHASAFVAGMTAAGVQTAVKHFPGLGYVVDNTDTTAGVTDTVTAPDGPTVASFASIIEKGAPLVMVSSAIYQRMDPKAPAVFSRTVVTGLLRQKVGFDGIIMSDDLSAATQVTKWKPGQRAIKAINAGVDIVLVSRTPDVAAEMVDAVVAEAKSDPAFAAKVTAAARLVVSQKIALGIR